MEIFIKKEFNKIKTAFKKYKEEINNIKKEIKDLKKEKNITTKLSNKELIEIDKLKDEIKFLKKVIYSIQTKKEIKIEKEEKKEIIGNKISLKYHYSSCPFTKRISPENMIIFSTKDEANKKGYSPCFCINENK